HTRFSRDWSSDVCSSRSHQAAGKTKLARQVVLETTESWVLTWVERITRRPPDADFSGAAASPIPKGRQDSAESSASVTWKTIGRSAERRVAKEDSNRERH